MVWRQADDITQPVQRRAENIPEKKKKITLLKTPVTRVPNTTLFFFFLIGARRICHFNSNKANFLCREPQELRRAPQPELPPTAQCSPVPISDSSQGWDRAGSPATGTGMRFRAEGLAPVQPGAGFHPRGCAAKSRAVRRNCSLQHTLIVNAYLWFSHCVQTFPFISSVVLVPWARALVHGINLSVSI